jgi:predicted alpha/beta-fold hydrolase
VSHLPQRWQAADFTPAWWLRGPHLQTLAGKLLRPKLQPRLQRERLELPDGDFLILDWGEAPTPDAPVCIVLHGLEGNARRPYALLLHQALREQGIQPVGLNFRSCSGEPIRTPRFYHSGETGDLRLVTEHIRSACPGRKLAAAGFSLGGNVLLKRLGELADTGPSVYEAAATISVPFDLSEGTRALESGWMGRNVYSRHLVRSLLAKAKAKEEALREAGLEFELLQRATSLREFDELATAPLHGFTGAEDYYARSSSNSFLSEIRVPTLLLQALDDPFLPVDALPIEAIGKNPHLHPAFTRHGGHVGFIGGGAGVQRFWAEREAARFLAETLGIAAKLRLAAQASEAGSRFPPGVPPHL